MRERLTSLGAEAVGSTPGNSAVIARDIAKWTPLAKTVIIRSIDSTASGEAHDVPYRSDRNVRRQRSAKQTDVYGGND
jgi:hypothetical protein